MRFGFAPIRGSNPRASASDQALCRDGRAPAFLSVINLASCWAIAGPAGQAAQDLGQQIAVVGQHLALPVEPLCDRVEALAMLAELQLYPVEALALLAELLAHLTGA
jgi:hypothetical protein